MTRILPLTVALTATIVTTLAVWPSSGERISAIRAPAAPEMTDVIPVSADAAIAIVTGSRVNFRSGPSPYFKIHYALSYGSVVEVLSQPSNDWVELRDLSTGQVGFMAADYLRKDQPLNG